MSSKKTCEACFHYDICNEQADGNIVELMREPCFRFKDKADLVELPCRMGDRVWGMRAYNRGRIAKRGLVTSMFFSDDMKLIVVIGHVCRGIWGEKVFATREEAEEAIKRRDAADKEGMIRFYRKP